MNKHFRQGDVLLVQVDELPEDVLLQPAMERIVLAYGEVTGHAHAITGENAFVHMRSNGDMFVELQEANQLTHEEHAAIALQPGIYQLVRQREYVPEGPRIVSD